MTGASSICLASEWVGLALPGKNRGMIVATGVVQGIRARWVCPWVSAVQFVRPCRTMGGEQLLHSPTGPHTRGHGLARTSMVDDVRLNQAQRGGGVAGWAAVVVGALLIAGAPAIEQRSRSR